MFLHTSASQVSAGTDLHMWLGRRARQPACEGFYVKRLVGWYKNGSMIEAIERKFYVASLLCCCEKSGLLEKIWSGWPANQSRFFQKTQKRRHVNNLDSPKNLLAKKNPLKEQKKHKKRITAGTQYYIRTVFTEIQELEKNIICTTLRCKRHRI